MLVKKSQQIEPLKNFFGLSLSTVAKTQYSAINKSISLNHYYHKSSGDKIENNLIVLHGILGSAKNFNPILKKEPIKSIANSYALDLRNHGSSAHAGSMTYAEMAQDLEHFI